MCIFICTSANQQIIIMKVFKFGGASINTVERIKNTGNIINSFKGEKILIIISAMGKTTNALEKVVDAFFAGRQDDALQLFEQVKESHLNMLKYLITLNWQEAENKLKDFFTETEWLLHDKPVKDYDYYYDQIVCCGELLSTSLVSIYLNEAGIKNKWVDVRDIVRTDDNFRDAFVDWNFTQQKIKTDIEPLFEDLQRHLKTLWVATLSAETRQIIDNNPQGEQLQRLQLLNRQIAELNAALKAMASGS